MTDIPNEPPNLPDSGLTPNIWPPISPVWIDEVQVAVELPMGPPGPEGPAPFFDSRPVVSLPAGEDPIVNLNQDPASGVWWFTFGIPRGEPGKDGDVGPPLNIMPLPDGYPPSGMPDPPNDFPPGPSIGDAYYVGTDLWVYGEGGWISMGSVVGPTGPPAYAHVSDNAPPGSPEIGEMWFRPNARAYTPNGLRVDEGLQMSGYGGHILGSADGSLLLGAGPTPDDPAAATPQASVGYDGMDVQSLDVRGMSALDYKNGELVISADGGPIRAGGPLALSNDPTADDHAVSMGFAAEHLVAKAGDTMLGPLTVPLTPTKDGHATSKKYVDYATDKLSTSYVKKTGDTMTGTLTIPGSKGSGTAVNIPYLNWALSPSNTSAKVYNATRVNGHRLHIGSTVVLQPSGGRFNVSTPTIDKSVVISNGHYDAYTSWVHIAQYSGGWKHFVVQGGYTSVRNVRVNWIIG